MTKSPMDSNNGVRSKRLIDQQRRRISPAMKLSIPALHHFHFFGGSKAVQWAKMICLVCKDPSNYGSSKQFEGVHLSTYMCYVFGFRPNERSNKEIVFGIVCKD